VVGVFEIYKYKVYANDKNFTDDIVQAEKCNKSDKFTKAKEYYEDALKNVGKIMMLERNEIM